MSYDVFTGLLKAFPLSNVDKGIEFICDTSHEKFDVLKKNYPLEEIAGNGDTFSKAVNILNWISTNIYHKGDYGNHIQPTNSLNLLEYAFGKGIDNGINCYALSFVLTECLLSIGIKAKTVSIMPCSPYDTDNHIVTHAFIDELNKWVMFDPTFNAYLKNQKDEPLSLLELREHLANQTPVFFNENAKYHDSKLMEEDYKDKLEYYAKDLFYFQVNKKSSFCDENYYDKNFRFTLAPDGFDVKQVIIDNIEYRIKLWGGNPSMQQWLENAKEDKLLFCSAAEFEKSPH